MQASLIHLVIKPSRTMKKHQLLTLAFLFAFSMLRADAGLLFPEDSISKDYWKSLDAKSQIIFLTAYRHTQGPIEDPTAKPGFQFLAEKHFPELVAQLNQFYSAPANEHVFVRDAIHICFMQMAGKPQAEIDKATDLAREYFMRL